MNSNKSLSTEDKKKALAQAQKAFDNPKFATYPLWKKTLIGLLAAVATLAVSWLTTSCGASISYDPDSGQVIILTPQSHQKVERGK